MDISVPTDYNLSVKEYNKISKYRYMEIEIEKKKWHLKLPVMTVDVEAMGRIEKRDIIT